MLRNSVKIVLAGLVALGAILGAPAAGAAQTLRYVDDDSPSVVIECGREQRAVMERRQTSGETQVVARCEEGQGIQARPVRYATSRPATRRSTTIYAERAPERSKTKSALMIAGSAATGAGVGAAVNGKKGALIGAAIGGGSASIYEAAKRR